MQNEVAELEKDISDRKNQNKDADTAIAKYKEQQNNVRNNREFESLEKEIEFHGIQFLFPKIQTHGYF